MAAVAALLLVAPLAQARKLVDATGVKVELVDRPARIVTLAPSLAELAAEALGEKELSRIVGVTEYTDHPATLASRTSVGPYYKFNVERVVSLKPDLVLATFDGNLEDQVRRLRELKIPVVVIESGSLAAVEKSMRLVGDAVGAPENGKAIAETFARNVGEIRARGSLRSPAPSVLLQVGDRPLVVVGGKSILSEALAVIGARNAYASSDSRYPKPSLEDARSRKPDRVVVLMLGRDPKPFDRMAADWTKIGLRARVLQGDTVVRPTSRMIEGLKRLEEAVHGK